MSTEYISRTQQTYFDSVSNYHRSEDLEDLRTIQPKTGWQRFLEAILCCICFSSGIDSNQLAQTIHTYFGGGRIDGTRFFEGKSVRELTTFKGGLEDIQRMGGADVAATIEKVQHVIEQKTSSSSRVGSVSVGVPHRHKKRSKKQQRDERQPLLGRETPVTYSERRTATPQPKAQPKSKARAAAPAFQVGQDDPMRFMAEHVIKSTRERTTTERRRVVAPASNPLKDDPRYGGWKEGVRVVPSDNPFQYPKVYAPRTTQATVTRTHRETEDLLSKQRARVLGHDHH